jgi:Alginate export
VASETGYRFPNVPLKPRFSAKADISSGDDPRKNTLRTFNPLFPKGNYFGVLATAGPGPINFIDAHPRVEATLPQGVTVSVDWIFQWRESLRDGVYSVPGFLIIPAGKSNARFVGNRPGTEVRWQGEPTSMVSSRLRDFLCRQVRERKPASPQPELLGTVGRLQVLEGDRVGKTLCRSRCLSTPPPRDSSVRQSIWLRISDASGDRSLQEPDADLGDRALLVPK